MLKDTLSALKIKFRDLGVSYGHVFSKENQFTHVVLKDLAKFCRAYDTTFHADARLSAALEGRREVWLRIQKHLNLDADEIYKLYIKE